jgi:hypothetical protein
MINSDIVVGSEWLKHATGILKRGINGSRLLLVTPRMDVDIPINALSDIHFCKRSVLYEIDRVMDTYDPIPHTRGGLDVFTYDRTNPPINLSLIPPFLMGRPAWDVWVAGLASSVSEVVSTDFRPSVFHLEHLVHHRTKDEWGVRYNDEVAEKNHGFYSRSSGIRWFASNGTLIRNKKHCWRENGHAHFV